MEAIPIPPPPPKSSRTKQQQHRARSFSPLRRSNSSRRLLHRSGQVVAHMGAKLLHHPLSKWDTSYRHSRSRMTTSPLRSRTWTSPSTTSFAKRRSNPPPPPSHPSTTRTRHPSPMGQASVVDNNNKTTTTTMFGTKPPERTTTTTTISKDFEVPCLQESVTADSSSSSEHSMEEESSVKNEMGVFQVYPKKVPIIVLDENPLQQENVTPKERLRQTLLAIDARLDRVQTSWYEARRKAQRMFGNNDNVESSPETTALPNTPDADNNKFHDNNHEDDDNTDSSSDDDDDSSISTLTQSGYYQYYLDDKGHLKRHPSEQRGTTSPEIVLTGLDLLQQQ